MHHIPTPWLQEKLGRQVSDMFCLCEKRQFCHPGRERRLPDAGISQEIRGVVAKINDKISTTV